MHAAQQSGETLGAIVGLLDDDSRERDLRRWGLWGLQVVVTRNKESGLLRPQAGETGRIGCSYPVSLSIFDLATEAPVSGLPSHPQAAIGIPWGDLKVMVKRQGPA